MSASSQLGPGAPSVRRPASSPRPYRSLSAVLRALSASSQSGVPSVAAAPAPIAAATDETGDVQPLEVVWNLGGYENNAVQRVRVHVD